MFGYGSLVSPESFGSTLGRSLRWGEDLHEADVVAYGRRWNYGVMHTTGLAPGDDGSERRWTLVALGVIPAPEESVNGVVGWVTEDELVGLDHRERHYDRVDVTGLTTVHGHIDGPVVTYVPRPEAIEHYERERDAGRAAIEQRYWDLVDGAFAALGPDRHQRYHATTPDPDVPVLSVRRD